MATNNSSKPRNPLQELPISTFTRSTSSSLASSSGTTPSSVSSLLSSGSSTSASSRSSGRIVHLPLSSPHQDPSSSRTIRPSAQLASPSARRWPSNTRHVRGSSLSALQTLTPGRLHHGLASSPLNPRSSTSGTPAEERRTARMMMLDEADGGGAGIDVDEEDEGRTIRRRGSMRDRDREMMPPPAVPLSVRADPGLSPGRSPARRLFTAPNTETTPRGSRISAGTLQPSPPLSARTSMNSITGTEDASSRGHSKPRARTSTGRESPVPTPVTEAVDADSAPSRTGDEEVSKKVRLDGAMSSVAKGKRREEPDASIATTSAVETTDEVARQRMENVDPHNCGFTVWQDTTGAGPSSTSSSSTQLSSSSNSNISNDSPSSSSMSEKNKKALAWLTIPFDNQENIKPPPSNVLVPFIMDTGGKGKSSAPVAPSSKSSASTMVASTSGSSASVASTSTASVSGTTSTSSAPSSAAATLCSPIPPRTTAPVRSSPVASPRTETSIRSTMRGNVAPINTGGGLRGPECASPVRATITPGHAVAQGREGSPTPTLKLRRTTTSLSTSRSFPSTATATGAIPARPVLVLRRTGSAENVNASAPNSPTSRTSTESALEQENAAITVRVLNADAKEKNSGENVPVDKRKSTKGGKKRKSDEMADPASGLLSDSAIKKPPTRSRTASTPASVAMQNRVQGRRTRRSVGGSAGNAKKTAAVGNAKQGSENGYEGRVLRSMTRAGNGL